MSGATGRNAVHLGLSFFVLNAPQNGLIAFLLVHEGDPVLVLFKTERPDFRLIFKYHLLLVLNGPTDQRTILVHSVELSPQLISFGLQLSLLGFPPVLIILVDVSLLNFL